jgi:hypothetical protein
MSKGQEVAEQAEKALNDAGLNYSNEVIKRIVNDNKGLTGYPPGRDGDYERKPPARGNGK